MGNKKENKALKVIRYIIYVILLIILCINFIIIIQSKVRKDKVPSIFGYKPFIVLSGSMQPNIMVGDLVLVKNVDAKELKVNDVIAFRDGDKIVTTHRIVDTDTSTGEKCFVTKGDSNNTKDEKLVCKNKIEGKMVKRIPKLGKAVNFIQQPLGFIIMMMTIFIIGLIIYLVEDKRIDGNYKKMSEEDLKAFEEFKKSKEKK